MKRIIISLCLAAAFSFVFIGCFAKKDKSHDNSGSLTEITFILDYTPNTNHTGLYVADKLGFYGDIGIKIKILQPPEGGSTVLVGTGRAQFGISFQEIMSSALTSDKPIPITAVAAIIDHNTSGIISRKDKGIDSFAKMAGKRYSTWDTPLERVVLREVMATQGANFDDVECVPAGAIDAISAIKTDIDAIWVYEAWDVMAAKIAGVPYNFIKFSDVLDVLDFYTPVIIANNDFLDKNENIAKAFMSATAKGYEYCIDNPKHAAQILVECVPELDIEMITQSQEYLKDQYKAGKDHWGIIDKSRWKEFYDWSYERGLISKSLGASGFSNDYLPQ